MTLGAHDRPDAETRFSDWVLDDHLGHIGARNGRADLLMVIAAGPLVAARLPTAFGSRGPFAMPVSSSGPLPSTSSR